MLATRVVQWLQLTLQNNVIAPTLSNTGPLQPPLFLRLMQRFPVLRRIPARLLGLGVRPEHVAGVMRHPVPRARSVHHHFSVLAAGGLKLAMARSMAAGLRSST